MLIWVPRLACALFHVEKREQEREMGKVKGRKSVAAAVESVFACEDGGKRQGRRNKHPRSQEKREMSTCAWLIKALFPLRVCSSTFFFDGAFKTGLSQKEMFLPALSSGIKKKLNQK